MYDWANSAFALSIMAVLYPLFLGSFWSAGASGASVTSRLAWITAGPNAVVAILAPLLGTIADAGGYTEFAKRSKVRDKRNNKTTTYNAQKIQDDEGDDPLLKPGDIVIVERKLWL